MDLQYIEWKRFEIMISKKKKTYVGIIILKIFLNYLYNNNKT